MSHITGYHVNAAGEVWIHLPDGETRVATDREWLHLFVRAPEMTLELAQRHGAVQ